MIQQKLYVTKKLKERNKGRSKTKQKKLMKRSKTTMINNQKLRCSTKRKKKRERNARYVLIQFKDSHTRVWPQGKTVRIAKTKGLSENSAHQKSSSENFILKKTKNQEEMEARDAVTTMQFLRSMWHIKD